MALNKPERGHVPISVDKKHFYIHPYYTRNNTRHDIGLIHLPRKVLFSEHIQPVKLPTACKSTLHNIDAFAMGHGITSDDASTCNELIFSFLKTLSPADCRDTFPVSSKHTTIICAQNAVKGQSVCRDDSGGPLVSRANGTLIGISSGGVLQMDVTKACRKDSQMYTLISAGLIITPV
ncbi:trypsin-7-like [Sitodiplosis mosellana]|uniref:trypsin-7-like n=1 Tax=Sitodiplosis mosellana TaxID=263140 RepID=UPI0024448CFA|nr:trypsin-7-like [Sitodiplosis mosellana]